MTWTVPPLSDCVTTIEPTEYTVLIRLAEYQEQTKGGIIIPGAKKETEDWRAAIARLVAVSPLAFSYAKWPEGARIPQVGDVVFVGHFPGKQIESPDGKQYRLCGDREILAVISRGG